MPSPGRTALYISKKNEHGSKKGIRSGLGFRSQFESHHASYGYALTGDHVCAKELLDSTLKIKGVLLSPYRIAQAYIALGDYYKALDLLDKYYEIRDLHLFWIKADPGFTPIRNKPRLSNY
jgi:hypothetical protein